MSFDHATMGQAWAAPGMDTRQWLSYGTVDESTEDQPSVLFKDSDGNPLPEGPRVMVTLQPSGITVPCRVGSFLAGVGEGSWFPFQDKDEVLVAVPEGNEQAGAVIITRLNQELDTWPTIVAGQDATTNTFGFWRLRTPFIIETAASFIIRSAQTTAQIGIDPTGQVIIADGDQNRLFIGPNGMEIGSGDGQTFMQVDIENKMVTIGAGAAHLVLKNADDAQGASQIFVPGSLNIGTAGAAGKGHAVTVEQLMAWTANILCGLAMSGAFMTPGAWSAASFPAGGVGLLNALFAAVLPAMVSPNAVGLGGAPGGNMTPLAAAFRGLLTAALSAPAPITDPTGLIPGFGRAALMY